jgi:hypothetical protein
MHGQNQIKFICAKQGIFKLRVTIRRAGKERCTQSHEEENVIHILLQMESDMVTDRNIFEL